MREQGRTASNPHTGRPCVDRTGPQRATKCLLSRAVRPVHTFRWMSAQSVDALSGSASIQELPSVEQDELDRRRKRHPSDGVTGRSRADEDHWLVLGLAVGVAARCRIPGSRMERRQAVWATPRAVVPAGVQQESGQFNSRPTGPTCIHAPSDPARSRVPDAPRGPRKSALFDPPAARRGPAVRRHARRLIAAPSTRPARVSLSPSRPARPSQRAFPPRTEISGPGDSAAILGAAIRNAPAELNEIELRLADLDHPVPALARAAEENRQRKRYRHSNDPSIRPCAAGDNA